MIKLRLQNPQPFTNKDMLALSRRQGRLPRVIQHWKSELRQFSVPPKMNSDKIQELAIHPSSNKKKGCGIFCKKKKEDFITCPSCNIFVWHKSCIEKICVDFSLNKPDFSSEKWTCPNCCKIWIIMCFWIHLGVVDHKFDIVDHKVNKESTLYWLMFHEHFESIEIIGDTVFIDFNPDLFSKIFLRYVYTFQKFKIWVYHFFELFLRKLFFR